MAQWSEDRPPLPADWDWRRERVFERDQRVCQLAFPGVCTVYATECDHKGDRDDHRVGSLQAVCSACHRVKTQGQSAEGLRAHWAKTRLPKRKHPGLL